MVVQIQLRHDTAANWTAANPTLALGEVGAETDTGKLKVGDGATVWTSLGYAPGGTIADILDLTTAEMTATKVLAPDGAGGVEFRAEAGGGMTNPMTTLDDIIVGGTVTGGVAAPARLGKGTDGQVLTVDPTTHHLLWATPSAGGSVATDAIWDAAGDLAVGSGANTAAKLPVGSEGDVLTIASGVPAWTPSSGGTIPLTVPGDILYLSSGTYTNQATAGLGATATALDYYGGWPESQAINGNDSDGYASTNGSVPRWFKVDLGAVRAIDRIRMFTGDTSYATAYTVEYSDTDSGYTDWGSRSSAPAEDIFDLGSTISARWWKFTATTLNSSGWHIHSLELKTLSGAALARLPIGTTGQVLKVVAGLPAWVT